MDRDVWVDWVTNSAFLEPLIRLAQEFGAMIDVVQTLSIVLGFLLVLWSLMAFLKRKKETSTYQSGDNGAGTRLTWGMIGGILMIYLSGTLKAFSGSMWGVSTLPSAMEYGSQAAGSADDPIKAAIYVALGIMVIVGWIFGLRSCYNLAQVGSDMGHGDGATKFWSSFVSMIFSAALINMTRVVDTLSATFTDTTFTTTLQLN